MKRFLLVTIAVLMAAGAAVAQDFTRTYSRMTGKVVDFSGDALQSETATQDIFNFGFRSKYVRICANPQNDPNNLIYIRPGTALATNTADIVADTTRNTVPASNSAAFIDGISGVFPERALPVAASDTGYTGPGSGGWVCTTQPWAINGIVSHVASGGVLATMTIWAVD